MATLDEISVVIKADLQDFERGMAAAEAGLGRVGAAAEASAGRYQDAAGKWRDGKGDRKNPGIEKRRRQAVRGRPEG